MSSRKVRSAYPGSRDVYTVKIERFAKASRLRGNDRYIFGGMAIIDIISSRIS